MILPQKTFFQNIKIKLNSNAWMTLKSSVVIFQALKPLQPQWPQWPQQPQWPQWPRQPHFIKKSTDLDGLIIPGTQITSASPFLWHGLSKIQFFTQIGNISVGGWWGQSMLFFWKLVVMPKNIQCQDSKTTFKQNLSCIFLSVRINLKKNISMWDTLQKNKIGLIKLFFVVVASWHCSVSAPLAVSV